MIEWAQTKLPELLGKGPQWAKKNIAKNISKMPGVDKDTPGMWKASAHVCVNDTVINWSDSYVFMEQQGIVATAPRSAQSPGSSVIDTGLYSSNRPVRLLNNAKPGDVERWKMPVTCITSNEQRKHLPNWLHGDETRLEVRLEEKKKKKKEKKKKDQDETTHTLEFEAEFSESGADCKALGWSTRPGRSHAEMYTVGYGSFALHHSSWNR
jgi:hypothetical protein